MSALVRPAAFSHERIIEHHYHYTPPPTVYRECPMWSRRSITGLASTPITTHIATRMPAGGILVISSRGTIGGTGAIITLMNGGRASSVSPLSRSPHPPG